MSPGDPSVFCTLFPTLLKLHARVTSPLFCLPKNLIQSSPSKSSLNVAKKKSNLCCHNTQKETEECKPLLQQKCHQVRNMLVGVWSKRFNVTKVQILTKYTNTHQMFKYLPNGRCSPNVQKHTKCTNAYQMC